MAMKNAESKISIKHSSNVVQRLYASKDILVRNNQYLATYKETVEEMATIKLSSETFENKVVPFTLRQMGFLDENGNTIEKKRNKDAVDIYRENLIQCWNSEDSQNQSQTLLNCWNAITDFESHYSPMRNASKKEILFNRAINGMVLSNIIIQAASELCNYKINT